MSRKKRPPKKKPRPSPVIVRARALEILRIRLDGAEWFDVWEYVREKEREKDSSWFLADGQKPMSDGQLWRYIAKSERLLAETCRASTKKLLRRHLAQRRNLYAKAVLAGDYRAALAVLKDEAELQGLYPPVKVAPTTPDGKKGHRDGSSSAASKLERFVAILDGARARRDAAAAAIATPNPDRTSELPKSEPRKRAQMRSPARDRVAQTLAPRLAV